MEYADNKDLKAAILDKFNKKESFKEENVNYIII